jgi:hypothetical protein
VPVGSVVIAATAATIDVAVARLALHTAGLQ